MSAACGAANALAVAPGAPWNPNPACISCRIGAITTDPTSTPMISATCCFHGVAPTSWPVLRSCRLSLEIVATPKTNAAVNTV
ncbi:Uncharacterised protein [Mycobacterium tuberculosis]|uniref:Uncharacterized protein n=1 Tax=Mycobacterium tuberculosis TaxID=1773 RepID=A0A916PCJ6_MYCTX|nr:Uncharacterised protein [Mycobacterium tuberculosis]